MRRTDAAVLTVVSVALALLTARALGPDLLDGSLVGGGEQLDSTGSLWAMWWFGEAVSRGEAPWTGSANAFPVGQSPVGYYNLMEAALGAPFVWLLGPARGYNVACGLVLWSTGVATVVAGRMTGARWPASVAAGTTVMLSPWVLLELTSGRLAQAWIAAPVLSLAVFSRVRDGQGGTPAGVAAGALLALSALTYWFHGLFVLIGAGALWAAPAEAPRKAGLPGLLSAAVTCCVLCGAPALDLAAGLDALPGVARDVPASLDHGPLGRGEFSINMAISQSSWVFWPLWSPDWDPADLRLPISLLGLAAAGAVVSSGRTPRLRWLLVAALGWILTLGPWLRGADGAPLPIPLPWLALHDLLPGFSRMWWPTRASVLVVPAVAFLAARGIDGITASLPRRRAIARVGLSLIVLVELGVGAAYLPIPRGPSHPVAQGLYERLDGALLTTPVLGRSADTRHLLWLQAHHGLPVLSALGDHLPAHVSPEHAAYVTGNPLLRALHDVAWDRMTGARVDPADVNALIDAGFRWAVVDPAAYPPRTSAAWSRQHREVLDSVFGPPTLAVGPVAAWRLQAPPAPVDLPALAPLQPGLTADPTLPVRVRRETGGAPGGPRQVRPRAQPTRPRSP